VIDCRGSRNATHRALCPITGVEVLIERARADVPFAVMTAGRPTPYRHHAALRLYWKALSDHRRLGDLSQSAISHPMPRRKLLILKWRDVRVVEGARLESVCRRNPTEGSNPSLSANCKLLLLSNLYS
jgi:hypothetical protein